MCPRPGRYTLQTTQYGTNPPRLPATVAGKRIAMLPILAPGPLFRHSLAEIQWTNWSVVKNLRIERPDGSALTDQPEQWRGTWFASIGASYYPDPNWTIRGGFAFDPTPVRNQFRTARIPDADRYWLAMGLGYKWTADLRFDAAYVHIFAGGAPINEVSQTGDLLAGRYSDHVDIVSLSATLRF
jgi:long-chain fatty acid transport protein